MKNSWWGQLSGNPTYVPEFELYDLEEDPKEQHNLFFERVDIANDLKPRLLDWIKKMNQESINFNWTKIENTELIPYP
jgi:hypothetical protein